MAAVSRLYIANVTKQLHIFSFWKNGVTKLQEYEIKAGTQLELEGDRAELEHIISLHRKYGLVEVNDVRGEERFSGIAFKFDSPINVQALRDAMEKRNDYEDERSQVARETAVAATDTDMNQRARERGLPELTTIVDIEERQTQGASGKPLKQNLKVNKDQPTTRSKK